jgi:biopolymer transport protein ExbD
VLFISVLDESLIELNGERLTLEQASQRLAKQAPQPVYVDSDGEASLQAVLRVTDLLQASGQTEVHLELLP